MYAVCVFCLRATNCIHCVGLVMSCFVTSGTNYRLRCLPYFYLIGTMKGGTTALFKLIQDYLPDFADGIVKEYHFWSEKRTLGLRRPECGMSSRLP